MTLLCFGLLLFGCAHIYGVYHAKSGMLQTIYLMGDAFIILGSFAVLFKLGWL